MEGTRKRFHTELADLEAAIVEEGGLSERAIGASVETILRRYDRAADEVIAADDDIDRLYLDVERRVLDLLALQTPVATDLRLVSAIMHINLHVERIGDQAVNIAKMAKLTRDLPSSPVILSHLEEMSDLVRHMIRAAIEAVVRGSEMPFEEGQFLEATLFGLLCASEDTKEGMKAFLEKRAPQFKGR